MSQALSRRPNFRGVARVAATMPFPHLLKPLSVFFCSPSVEAATVQGVGGMEYEDLESAAKCYGARIGSTGKKSSEKALRTRLGKLWRCEVYSKEAKACVMKGGD